MNALIASEQATRIIHELGRLRGSSSVRVVAKTFARRGPAEAGTGYHEATFDFDAHKLQSGVALQVAHHTDEILITLRGDLSEPASAGELIDQVSDFMNRNGIGDRWEVRTHFSGRGPNSSAYRVDLFTAATAHAEYA